MLRLWKEKEKQQMLEIKWLCTLSEASGCSGPSKLQWKEARSSSGRGTPDLEDKFEKL